MSERTKKTPERIASWAMEIQQLKAALARTREKLALQQTAVLAIAAKLGGQERELAEQEARFAAQFNPTTEEGL